MHSNTAPSTGAFLDTVLVVLLATFDLTPMELALLGLTIGLVIICELVIRRWRRPWIFTEVPSLSRHCQECGSRAVLMAAVTSLVMGYLLFFDKVACHIRSLCLAPWAPHLLSL